MTLSLYFSGYKGIIQHSQLIWMCDWTFESLSDTTSHFFNSSPLATVSIEDKHRLLLDIDVCV